MQWTTQTYGFDDESANFWYRGQAFGIEEGNTLIRTLVEVEFSYLLGVDVLGNNNVFPPCGVTCGLLLNPDGPIDTGTSVFTVSTLDWLWTGSIGANYANITASNPLDDPNVVNYRFVWVNGHTGPAESVKGQRRLNSSDYQFGFNWRYTGEVDPFHMSPVPAGAITMGTAYVRTLWLH